MSYIPKILIIGVGHFGYQHFLEWQKLSDDGKVVIEGLVVASDESCNRLQKITDLPIHIGFNISLLENIDAVDIVTPSNTHFELVSACLPYVDVLVEKPLCMDHTQAKELFLLAKKNNRCLMVGHIYRYHPLTKALKEKIKDFSISPDLVTIEFTNPHQEHITNLDPFLEWTHVFDLLNDAFPSTIKSCNAWSDGHLAESSITTQTGVNAVLRSGWTGTEKARKLSVYYADYRFQADFQDGALIIKKRNQTEKHFVGSAPQTLHLELTAFLQTIEKRTVSFPSAEQVLATLQLASCAKDSAQATLDRVSTGSKQRPKVAIIGGGVFGATCAIELSQNYDVTLFERNEKLLSEASYFNQWRHHSGFHYPRSIETIQEVQLAKIEFESVFEDAIKRDIDAYFAVSGLGSEISKERYLATCDATGLKYDVVDPPAGIVYPEKLSVCLHTDEAVVDIDHLTEILMSRIAKSSHIELRLNCEVLTGNIVSEGAKELVFKQEGVGRRENFDFLINASYANSNIISKWFNFPVRPLRFDRLELAVYEIPHAPRFMMTLLDAPFTSLTSLGHDDLFMLSHIHQSVLASQVTADGLPPKWDEAQLNYDNLLRHGLRYLPILKNARYVESRIGIRTVTAYSEDFDGRPTVVMPHGFGCWSILGGKIITAVSNAREIKRAIALECGIGEKF